MTEPTKEDSSNINNWSSEGSEFELAEEDILTYGRSNLNSSLLENILVYFKKFTPVQRKAIPVISSGRDVLIKSQTGSGKTLAALIPLLNSLIDRSGSFNSTDLKCLIIVPSNDLLKQVFGVLKILLKKCSNKVTYKELYEVSDTFANVVVTKPSIAVEIAKDKDLLYLVVDEADLLFEFGYKNDTLKLIELLRTNSKFKKFQTVMLSATLDYEIKNIANLLLYKPIYVDIPFTEKLGNVNEYYILVDENNKLVTLYVLLKMESIPYGSIIFVNTNKKGYHLYCFLRKLSLDINIISKLLSPKLRHSILQNFNQGLLGCLILVDDETEGDFNLSRGVDFKNVNCVINFDEPKSLEIYKHRIGRTGRNYHDGSSLTFFTKNDSELLLQLTGGEVMEDRENRYEEGEEKDEEDDEDEYMDANEEDDEEMEEYSEEDDDEQLEEEDKEENINGLKEDKEMEEDTEEYEEKEVEDKMEEEDEDDEVVEYDNNYNKHTNGIQKLFLDEKIFESFKYRVNDVLKSITPKLVEIAQIQSVRHSAIEQEEFLKNINENEMLLLKSVLKNDNKLLKPDKKHLTFIPKYLVDKNLRDVVNDIKYQIYPSDKVINNNKNKINKIKRKETKEKSRFKNKKDKKRKYFRKRLPQFKPKKK